MTFTEDIAKRYEAWNWQVLQVEDGNDIEAIDAALKEAQVETERPTIIIVTTIIGYGSPNFAGTSTAHGKALGAEEVKLTKEAYGWPQEDFFIPDAALEHFRSSIERGQTQEQAWNAQFEAWRAAYPDLAAEWDTVMAGELPDNWDADVPIFSADDKPMATRNANGKAINALAKNIPTMIGGDADLAGSTKTLIDGEAFTGHKNPAARNLRFGVREHAMGAIVNGLALHGGVVRPYSATFLTFSDYMRPAMRLGALMGIKTAYVFTHDSIGVGEDGPTHQPVEQVMSLRNMPGMYVFRPGDANESAAAWRTAMTLDGPTTLIFSRQDVQILDNHELIHTGVAHGAYVLGDSEGTPDVILLAAGTEVEIAYNAYQQLRDEGVKARVVSMPCWELFEEQDATYKESVLPANVTARVSIEAGVTLGWQKYTGLSGINIGVDRFGASAPYAKIYEEYGLTVEKLVEAAKSLL